MPLRNVWDDNVQSVESSTSNNAADYQREGSKEDEDNAEDEAIRRLELEDIANFVIGISD